MEPVYDVDYFIAKFEAIPEKRIISNEQSKKVGFFKNTITHCAIGWCDECSGITYGFNREETKEGEALVNIFYIAGIRSITYPKGKKGWCVADVNNGNNPRYQHSTPKQRILAALYDIKKLQQPIPEVKKERIVYVTIPETIKVKTEKLIENEN